MKTLLPVGSVFLSAPHTMAWDLRYMPRVLFFFERMTQWQSFEAQNFS
ncbi:MAG: hypothetical protein K2I90_10830 [Odoribacter sp.]|nr:hypothetical protein [Odoribacter sp.]